MIAIYPGSFDPVTNGHLDIILRASQFVSQLIVAPFDDYSAGYNFTIDERVEHLNILTNNIENVIVERFNGLLVNFAKTKDAKFIIRGLRNVSDFEYELHMAFINKSLDKNIETLFFASSVEYLYMSSSTVEEIARFGGDIDKIVPHEIKQFVIDRFKNKL
jgi:pantetheine-phosphate adenylyltransferase